MLALERHSVGKNTYAQVLSPSNYDGTILGTCMMDQNGRWDMPSAIMGTDTVHSIEKILINLIAKFKDGFDRLKSLYLENNISEAHVIDKFSITLAHILAYGGNDITVSLSNELSISFVAKNSETKMCIEYFLIFDANDPEDEEIIITLNRPGKNIVSYGGDFLKTWDAILKEL